VLVRYWLNTYRFHPVSLNIDAVLKEVTISQRKKKLNQMIQGNGLQDAYSARLARVGAQDGGMLRLNMEALMWLSHSNRALNANELCQGSEVAIGSTDLDCQNIPAIEILRGCYFGLVTLEESSNTLHLVHYTLEEYLSENADLFPSPHSGIAEVSSRYLNFRSIKSLLPAHLWSRKGPPLLEYTSCYWGKPARGGITTSVNTFTLRLPDRFDKLD